MRLFCTQENLSNGLNQVSHIASKNINLPILNNILLKIENKFLKLCATNLEIGITSSVRGKIDEDGEFAVDAKVITDYVNLLPKENIELRLENNSLKIDCGNYHTQINGANISDFPTIPPVNKNNRYKILLSTFKNALQQIIVAVATNELRPEISGVLFSFNFENKKLTLVATDSYRLAEKVITFESVGEKEKNISAILPLRTIQEILRILTLHDEVLENDKSNITLCFDDNQVLFENTNTELVSKLIEGQYPDYKQIIPQDFRTNIIINKNELQKAIKAASIFTKSGIYDIEFKIDINKNELEIFTENSQIGKNSVKVDAQMSGENNNIVLNFRYLLDGLQNINTKQVAIDIIDNSVPCIVRMYKDDGIDKEYLYLIMPIRR